MGKIKTFLLVILSIILVGCNGTDVSLPDFSSSGFECEFSYLCDGTNVRATLMASAPNADGTKRDITLTFAEPHSLSGIRIERKDGKISAHAEDIEWQCEDLDALLEVTELFEISGEISASSIDEIAGETCNRIVIKKEDGSASDVYISSKNSLPLRICGNVSCRYVELNIIRFERK